MSRFLLVTLGSLIACTARGACDDHLGTDLPFLAGESLRYEVDRVTIVGIPGLVRASGRIEIELAAQGQHAVASLHGTASARAPLMKPYEISLRMSSQLDPGAVHSRGFSHWQRTSTGGPDNFEHVYEFDLQSGRWQRDEEIRRLPERPQDMVSSIYYARALALTDLDCSMERYFDRRQNPMHLRSRQARKLKLPWSGETVPTREVRWKIDEPRGSIHGGSVFITEDEDRWPLRFEIHLSFASIGMSLQAAERPDPDPEPATGDGSEVPADEVGANAQSSGSVEDAATTEQEP